MKHCDICQQELPSSLDEYGPDYMTPVCRSCYFESVWEFEELDEITVLRNEIEAIEEEMVDMRNEIEGLEQEISDLETCIRNSDAELEKLTRQLRHLESVSEWSRRSMEDER